MQNQSLSPIYCGRGIPSFFTSVRDEYVFVARCSINGTTMDIMRRSLTRSLSSVEWSRLAKAFQMRVIAYDPFLSAGKAKELEAMGADSICVKDMAGLIAPYDAYAIVKALKGAVEAARG